MKFKIWGYFIIILALLITGYWQAGLFLQLYHYLIAGDMLGLAQYIRSFGLWAVLISLFLNVLVSLLTVLPSVLLSGANAIVFGLFWGTIISWVGEVLGATVTYWFYRILGRKRVQSILAQKRFNWQHYINRFTETRGFEVVFLSRLAPFVPSGLVTGLAAVSNIPFGPFLAGTALGKLPSLILESFLGHDLFFFQDNKGRFFLLLILIGTVYASYKLIEKKRGKLGREKS